MAGDSRHKKKSGAHSTKVPRPPASHHFKSPGSLQVLIAPIVFVLSLFGHNLSIYEVHNNGDWYNFGYLFGLACFLGGGGNQAARRKQNLTRSA